MYSKIKTFLYRINKAAGLEIVLLPEQQCRITLVILALHGNSAVIERKLVLEEGSISGLKKYIEKDVPVSLVFNGRGILHKKISESGSDTTALLQSVLPNGRAQDFYIQNCISENGSVLSIIRKELADPFLETIRHNSLHPIGFSLGGIVVVPILPLILKGKSPAGFSWAGHTLELEEPGTITNYNFSVTDSVGKPIQLDSEYLEEEYLVAYAAAFGLLIASEPVIPFVETVMKDKEEFLHKRLFRKFSGLALGFFFLLLMVNFLLFTRYSSRNHELLQKAANYSSMFAEMETLGKEVQEKETFLSEAGWLQSSSVTYFADRIAATLPVSVTLTELSINPRHERKSKEEKKELFNAGKIILTGASARPTELNEWLDRIKLIAGVNKARLIHYAFDNREKKGVFSIEIETEN